MSSFGIISTVAAGLGLLRVLQVNRSLTQRGISMNAEIKDGKLHLTLDITPQESASGKSLVIASTRGNTQTAVQYKGQNVTVGVNAYIPKKK